LKKTKTLFSKHILKKNIPITSQNIQLVQEVTHLTDKTLGLGNLLKVDNLLKVVDNHLEVDNVLKVVDNLQVQEEESNFREGGMLLEEETLQECQEVHTQQSYKKKYQLKK
jgi:hypothetical protein